MDTENLKKKNNQQYKKIRIAAVEVCTKKINIQYEIPSDLENKDDILEYLRENEHLQDTVERGIMDSLDENTVIDILFLDPKTGAAGNFKF